MCCLGFQIENGQTGNTIVYYLSNIDTLLSFIHFFVHKFLELKNGFAIDERKVEKYETEEVKLVCRGSIYVYKYLRWKVVNPVTNKSEVVFKSESETQTPDGRMKRDDEETAFELVSTLTIPYANRSDSGTYYCIGKLEGANNRNKTDLQLNIKGGL